jgi:nicotinate-nucleotide adenylyltransferase
VAVRRGEADELRGARALGVLGGTFNPPHVGHLAVARSALAELGLERVLLMPAHVSPHKAGSADVDPGAPARLQMCRLAASGVAGVSVSAMEVERGGVSYTVETLRELHATHPDAELTLLLGADTASTLPSWREPRALLELARVGVAARAGADRTRVLSALRSVDGVRERAAFLAMPAVEVSSSLVRARVAAGEPVEDLVGAAVARYIAEHDLYGAGARAVGR